MTGPGSKSALLALLLAAGLAAACASSASITEIQTNPSHYQNRTVTLTGVVTSAWGLPLVPLRMYRVSDGHSEILVVSNGQRTPTRGARVRVRGRVEDVAVLAGRPVGLHLREKGLKIL
ncbi:MAG: hypothetical protein IT180_08845 [Acidobacteria bacterium]|nr:hypothetical protein [Acidobacteriota bacterium]